MKTFKEFKDWFTESCSQAGACSPGLQQVEDSTNFPELIQVIKEHFHWCYKNLELGDILNQLPDEDLVSAQIYYNKQGIEQREGHAYYHSSTSKHYGSSTSKHYGSSTSEHYDSSTSNHYSSSTSEHYHSSYGDLKNNKENHTQAGLSILRQRNKIYITPNVEIITNEELKENA